MAPDTVLVTIMEDEGKQAAVHRDIAISAADLPGLLYLILLLLLILPHFFHPLNPLFTLMQ